MKKYQNRLYLILTVNILVGCMTTHASLKLEKVDRIETEYVLYKYYVGPVVSHLKKGEWHITVPHRGINPGYTIASNTDFNKRVFFLSRRRSYISEFSADLILLRQIPLSAFGLPEVREQEFEPKLYVYNDHIWVSVSDLYGKEIVMQWNIYEDPSKKISGPSFKAKSAWTVDTKNNIVYILASPPIKFDFNTKETQPLNWQAYENIDYSDRYGIILSNPSDEKSNDIVLKQDAECEGKVIAQGKGACWSPDYKVYFIRNQSELWRCEADGTNVVLVYSIEEEAEILNETIRFSNQGDMLAFCYRTQRHDSDDDHRETTVVIDLNKKQFMAASEPYGYHVILKVPEKAVTEKHLSEFFRKASQGTIPVYIELHDAIFAWPTEKIAWLLQQAEDINKKDISDSTPLHYAAELHRYDVVRLLLQYKPYLNVQNKIIGDTPLHKAIYGTLFEFREPHFVMDKNETIRLLIEAGADMTISNIFGETPKDLLENLRENVTGSGTLFDKKKIEDSEKN